MNFEEAKANEEKNLQTIYTKAWEDDAFKQALLDNPVTAIESLSGKPLELKGKNIVVTDQSDINNVYINIPHNPNDMELTEEELEAVAGGTTIVIGFTLICVEF